MSKSNTSKTSKNGSGTAKICQPKRRGSGRPFQPGPDPRRHMSGWKCKDAVTFAQEFNRALAQGGDPAALAVLLWKRAMKGETYATDVILDRLLGPVSKLAVVSNQPILFSIEYKPDGEPKPGEITGIHPREPILIKSDTPDPTARG